MRSFKKAIRWHKNTIMSWIGTLLITPVAFAHPVLENVTAGQAAVQQTPHSTVIHQTSQKAIINWQSFNIGHEEKTHFQQPTNGITLNRINPHDGASQIYGQLSATNKIILVNPAGIHFGPGATINVGSIIATTATISNQDFLNDQYRFTQAGPGAIVNEGRITAANHGLAALISRGTVNHGFIQANLGHIVLASGEAFTFSFADNHLVHFSIDAKTTQRGRNYRGKPLANGVHNTGTLLADGGKVIVTAKAARGVLDHVINMEGIIQARSVSQHHGEVILSGDASTGIVRVATKIQASAKRVGKKGGKVKITGHDIILDPITTIDTRETQSSSKDNIQIIKSNGDVLVKGNRYPMIDDYFNDIPSIAVIRRSHSHAQAHPNSETAHPLEPIRTDTSNHASSTESHYSNDHYSQTDSVGNHGSSSTLNSNSWVIVDPSDHSDIRILSRQNSHDSADSSRSWSVVSTDPHTHPDLNYYHYNNINDQHQPTNSTSSSSIAVLSRQNSHDSANSSHSWSVVSTDPHANSDLNYYHYNNIDDQHQPTNSTSSPSNVWSVILKDPHIHPDDNYYHYSTDGQYLATNHTASNSSTRDSLSSSRSWRFIPKDPHIHSDLNYYHYYTDKHDPATTINKTSVTSAVNLNRHQENRTRSNNNQSNQTDVILLNWNHSTYPSHDWSTTTTVNDHTNHQGERSSITLQAAVMHHATNNGSLHPSSNIPLNYLGGFEEISKGNCKKQNDNSYFICLDFGYFKQPYLINLSTYAKYPEKFLTIKETE